jgi:GT2 family glycosyltransferase
MTYKKEVLLAVGGFNNNLTFRSDDKYIFFKVKEYADEIYYVPDASVRHYIDSHRLEFTNFRKLFLKTGNEEKIRIRSEGNTSALFKKGIEYLAKTAASLLIYLLYGLKGQEIKGRYVFFSQWFTLRGFFMSKVHVR